MSLTLSLSQTSPIPLAAELSCAPGEVLALVGRSGSGKTTLLRSISGAYRPAQGAIIVNGKPWFDSTAGVFLPPHRRKVGMVFQSYALFPHMTALDNILIAMGAQKNRERARELLRQLDGGNVLQDHQVGADLAGRMADARSSHKCRRQIHRRVL